MITPTQEYAHARHKTPPKLFAGLDAGVHRLHGNYGRRQSILTHLTADAERIDATAPAWKEMTDSALRVHLFSFREQFRRSRRTRTPKDDELLVAAAGALREAAHRTVGLLAYKVQLMGTLALARGYLCEMATGEGKTLTAGMAAVIAGWTAHPCHVITVNDYLVKRDAEWLSPLYQFCGLETRWVTSGMEPAMRQQAYAADVTYATAKEVLADFLRDAIRLGALRNPSRRLIRQLVNPNISPRKNFVLRGLHTAIVDEADSILIDEAVTPLIIASQRKNRSLVEATQTAAKIVEVFHKGVEYELNTRYREIEFTNEGYRRIDDIRQKFTGLWRNATRCEELLRQALSAREFYLEGKQYIVVDGRIVIVDEFTGRPMPMRSWQQGMHQAIEAKAGLEISDPTETTARCSFQRFFRCYHRLSGMTGTASEAADEFWQIYSLPTLRIPANRPCIRREHPDRVFQDQASKWNAVVDEVKRVHATGRPVLVGTRNVAASQELAALLEDSGLMFRVLNAVHLKEEANIIASAGGYGCITIATNMAGRGTDIKLAQGVAALGGLHVIATERHESGRIDRQLFGRCARQGDPGSSQAFVSADDELLAKFLGPAQKKILPTALRIVGNQSKNVVSIAMTMAQKKAERAAFNQRRTVLTTDTWLDESLSFAPS